MNKTLNFRYLLRLILVLGVVGVAVHFIHRRQAGRQAEVFLNIADEAQKKGDVQRSISYLSRYLVLKPDDVEVRSRMGLAMARIARTADEKMQAFLVLEQVLRDAPERDDVRRKSIRLAMESGHFTEAMGHIEVLVRRDTGGKPDEFDANDDWNAISNGNDGELFDLYGQCLAASTGDFLSAEKNFGKAIKLQPTAVGAFARRAAILRHLKLNRPTQADAVIGDLVALNKYSSGAWLIAAAYLKQFPEAPITATNVATGENEVVTQEKAVAEALKLNPDGPEVLLTASNLAVAKAERLRQVRKAEEAKTEVENARRLLEKGIEKNPPPERAPPGADDERDRKAKRNAIAELYRSLVALEVRAGRIAEAEKWVRQGFAVLDEHDDLTLSLADVLILKGKTAEATTILKKLADVNYPAAVLGYHRARIEALSDRWLEAIKELRLAMRDLTEFPAFQRQAYFLLGECYDRIGETDLRHEAFKRAQPSDPFDPFWVPATVAVAAAEADMGRTKEAIKNYETVLDSAPGVAVLLARLLFIETIRERDAKKRDWKPVERVLKDAPESLDAVLLRADVQVIQGKPDTAKQILDAARAKYEGDVSLWVAYAVHAYVQKDADRSAQYLKDAEAKFGDRVEIRLARARLLPFPLTPEGSKQLARLAEGTEKFKVPERRRLLAGLAERARELGANEIASGLWEQLAVVHPDNLAVHHRRFDRAIQTDDKLRIEKVIDEIRRIDGSGGTSSRTARAMYLIWQARKGDKSGLDEAKKLLASLEQERQGWSRIPLGLALVYDLQGATDEALDKYRKAVELGVKDPEVIGRLAQLYIDRRRYADADALLRQNPEALTGKESLLLLAAESSYHTGEAVRALEMAEKAVGKDSKDFRKQLWLGRMRWLCGKRAEAEAPFRKAVELEGSSPETWMSLIQYLVYVNRAADAEKLLDEARPRMKKAEVSFYLAQGYEILGRAKEAQEWYDETLSERPDDIAVLRSVANFKLRQARNEQDLKAVRGLLEGILKLNNRTQDDTDFARRLLAISLAISPDYETRRRSLAFLGILDGSRLELTGTVEQLRSRALVLSLQPGRRSKLDAVQLLEEIEGRRSLQADDEFLLAQLNVLLDYPDRAHPRLAKLAATSPQNPLYVAYYVRRLLAETGATDEARKGLDVLAVLQPDAPRTAELRFRLLIAENKKTEAVDGLLAAVKKKKEMALAAARLLENFKEVAAAEALLQQLIADSKKPTARLLLAEFYARQNRNKEAIDLLERDAKDSNPAALAAVALGVLYTLDQPTKDDIARVRALVERHKPKGADQFMEDAALRNSEGDYDGSIKAYRQALVRDPANVLAMNNLAFLVAFHEDKHAEAADLIRKAKSQSKPEAVLMDTEAMISIAAGDIDKALELLADAAIEAPTGTTYFHIAWAQDTAKRPKEAKAAMEKAKKLGLRPSDVHLLERSKYQELVRKYH